MPAPKLSRALTNSLYKYRSISSTIPIPSVAATAYLGYVSAILMILLYLGRLIILQATSLAIVIPALLEGFIVNPLWYIWLGLTLMRNQSHPK